MLMYINRKTATVIRKCTALPTGLRAHNILWALLSESFGSIYLCSTLSNLAMSSFRQSWSSIEMWQKLKLTFFKRLASNYFF